MTPRCAAGQLMLSSLENRCIMKKIALFGGGAHAKVLIDCLEQEARYEITTILDDNPSVPHLLNYEVSKRNSTHSYENEAGIISITNCAIRKKIAEALLCDFITTIHPTAIVSPYALLGVGTQVLAGAIVNTGAKVGNHCIVNTGTVVEHDCVLSDFVHLAPNTTIGGGVKIGCGTQIGIGSCVIQNITIGANVIIGAGSVVITDLPDNCTAVGVPAKPIKFHEVTC